VERKNPKATVLTDVGATNYAWSNTNKNEAWAPTGQFPDSNPYAVISEGNRSWVVDAGSNTVTLVEKKPHNTYTQISSETGIVGLLLYLSMIFFFAGAGMEGPSFGAPDGESITPARVCKSAADL